MCRLSKIDESTFGDGCVNLRRPMIDVSTFEDRRSIVDVSTFEHRCEIRLLNLLKILILTINVCELRRGFALQCFHFYVLNAYLYCVYALVGGAISIRDPYICAVTRVCANESHAVFHGPSTGPLSV